MVVSITSENFFWLQILLIKPILDLCNVERAAILERVHVRVLERLSRKIREYVADERNSDIDFNNLLIKLCCMRLANTTPPTPSAMMFMIALITPARAGSATSNVGGSSGCGYKNCRSFLLRNEFLARAVSIPSQN